MRGLVLAVQLSVLLVWVPLGLWLFGDLGNAIAWLMGVMSTFASHAAGEARFRQEGNSCE